MKKMKHPTQPQEEITTTLAQVACGIGIGIVAGLVGTAVMTAAQMIEMQFSGREPSNTPYKAVKKTFGFETKSEEAKELISNVTHFAYGTTWDIPRGLMAAFGTKSLASTSAHFGAVWGTELGLLPAMDVAEPVTEWQPKAIAEDAMFHAIYALAVGLTADAMVKWSKDVYPAARLAAIPERYVFLFLVNLGVRIKGKPSKGQVIAVGLNPQLLPFEWPFPQEIYQVVYFLVFDSKKGWRKELNVFL
jgi:hypothetical protein